MLRRCDSCGVPYEFRRPSSRFCSPRCRQRHHRSPTPVVPLGVTPSGPSPLVDRLAADLTTAGQLETVLGQLALALAEQLSAAGQSGASTATLSKELRAVMEILAASRTAPDLIDELRRRREVRLARS